MSDSELLEKAASAAGFEWRWFGEHFCTQRNPELATYKPWNPLTDDGDALRLAVKLALEVDIGRTCAIAYSRKDRDLCTEDFEGSTPDASTRRAIVRAAAEIGATA